MAELSDSDNLVRSARYCALITLLVNKISENKAILRATAYVLRVNLVLHKFIANCEDACEAHTEYRLPKSSFTTAAKPSGKVGRRELKNEGLVPAAVTIRA